MYVNVICDLCVYPSTHFTKAALCDLIHNDRRRHPLLSEHKLEEFKAAAAALLGVTVDS